MTIKSSKRTQISCSPKKLFTLLLLCAPSRIEERSKIPFLNRLPHSDKSNQSRPLAHSKDRRDIWRANGSKIFNSPYFFSGYWQIKMTDDLKDVTMFVTRYGTFRFEVMPFGLIYSPSPFSVWYMEISLASSFSMSTRRRSCTLFLYGGNWSC